MQKKKKKMHQPIIKYNIFLGTKATCEMDSSFLARLAKENWQLHLIRQMTKLVQPSNVSKQKKQAFTFG